MKIERYQLKAGDEPTVFEFTSIGPRGEIRKIIEFQFSEVEGLYNLAFGDKHPITGEIDDLSVADNDDTDKVLATVVDAVYTFFAEHPYASVYATGSTPARTRLYRMGLTRFYGTVQDDFYLFGRIASKFYRFEIGKDYEAFLVQRKTF